jgi:hypothetical protein
MFGCIRCLCPSLVEDAKSCHVPEPAGSSFLRILPNCQFGLCCKASCHMSRASHLLPANPSEKTQFRQTRIKPRIARNVNGYFQVRAFPWSIFNLRSASARRRNVNGDSTSAEKNWSISVRGDSWANAFREMRRAMYARSRWQGKGPGNIEKFHIARPGNAGCPRCP